MNVSFYVNHIRMNIYLTSGFTWCQERSPSKMIPSLNRSSSVASELPHGWFGGLDTDLGWVKRQACAWQTCLEWGRKVEGVYFSPRYGKTKALLRKHSLSLDYESPCLPGLANTIIHSITSVQNLLHWALLCTLGRQNKWATVLGI